MKAYQDLISADAWQLTFDAGTEENVRVVVPRSAGFEALWGLYEIAYALEAEGAWVSLLGLSLLHDGWPVDEPKLRASVGDAQVERWLAEGLLTRGVPDPLPMPDAVWDTASLQQALTSRQ